MSLPDLFERILSTMPEGARALEKELRANTLALIESQLKHLDLVTRQEFEAQQCVLMETRQRVQALESELATLRQISAGGSQSGSD